jgi:hypothetical protein
MVAGDKRLRESLLFVLTGSIRERAWGAVALTVGVCLSVAGSVLSNVG